MGKLKSHASNVALPHTIFSLPFALASSFMATQGHPDFWTVILILVAITSARWAAIAIDNLADLKYDKLQPRLSYRAMVRGEISKGEALIFIVICMVVLVVTVAQLPPICLKLLPVAAIPFILYPFTKRFTAWCHLCLGVAIAMAPAGAWVALTELIGKTWITRGIVSSTDLSPTAKTTWALILRLLWVVLLLMVTAAVRESCRVLA